MRNVVFAFIICLFIFPVRSFAEPPAEAKVSLEDASDHSYLPKAIRLIQNAHESIDVSMYQILLSGDDPEHPVAKILKALADARARGVKVRVLLNRTFDYAAGETLPLARSVAAYEYLTRNGIDVAFAHSSRRLHDKLIVIDGRFVIEGSTNWTRTALLGNWESNAVIDSPEYAAAKLARLRAIPVSLGKSIDTLGDEGEEIEIPAVLLTDKKYFPDMVEDKDERIFEFYLWLVKEKPMKAIPDETLFRVFRLDPAKSQKDKRREAVRLLKKLAKMELIELKIPNAGADAEISLKEKSEARIQAPNAPVPMAETQEVSSTSVSKFSLPLSYFDYNLPARLSFAAEFVYLVARYEMSRSPSAPWWWRPQEVLTGTYHIHHTTLAAGMLELQRENLIEIVRDDAPGGRPHSERLVNRYRVNRLVDPAERAANFKNLSEKAGRENFDRARSFADAIDEPNDPLVITTILKWMTAYPASDLDTAFAQVARYERNNPRRSLYYLYGILEGMRNPKRQEQFSSALS